jgi:hypothetical protein
MNSSQKDDSNSNQETQAFEPLVTHEEEVVNPVSGGDESDGAEKSENAQEKEDKERSEMVTKEAMLRVTGGQL